MELENKKKRSLILNILGTVLAVVVGGWLGLLSLLVNAIDGNMITLLGKVCGIMQALTIPIIVIPLIWVPKGKKKIVVILGIIYIVLSYSFNIYDYYYKQYDGKITVDTSPNIDTSEYLPFDENSKIVKFRSETLQLERDLPRIDGAAALFPVYSAFVNATYPEDTKLANYEIDSPFHYRNTPSGYRALAEKESDIFIGVYPSEEQIAYAEENNTEFVYTQIGTEAFVFITHKDNPVNSLTTQQIKDIYSGKVINWKEVGGENFEIEAYQRNEGSGSQSMLKRFMDGTTLMKPPTDKVNDLMSGIIERVSDYRSKSNSIGFSFRYYVDGIIKNPDIKMLSIDGIEPTAKNIRNGSYPITTPIYAVTYKNNSNENVDKLLEWICGEEGQKIINETGYVGIR